MVKLENMNITDIIDKTNLYLTPRTLFDIWKNSDYIPNVPKEMSGEQALIKDRKLAERLCENEYELYRFLLTHDNEIDKFKFVIIMLLNYKERLAMSGGLKLKTEEEELIQKGIKGIRQLIKGTNYTFVNYNTSSDGNRITHLTIINTKEETEGIERKSRNSNSQRLEEIKKDADFRDIMQGIFTTDIEYSTAFEETVGSDIRFMVEFNTVVREYGDEIEKLDKNISVSEAAKKIDRIKFVEEMAIALEQHIEEINIDRLLLCSAYRYIEGLENGYIKKSRAEEVKRRLEIIRKHIVKNTKVTIYPDILYTIKDLERDIARFVGSQKNVTYLSQEDVKELKDALLSGEITLNSLGKSNFNAMALDMATISEVLRKNPNNYIFFLREEECPYTKTVILNDIKNNQRCSTDLLKLLCEKADITSQEICDLYDQEIISASDLRAVREKVGTVITDEILFEKYKQYKANSEQEEARTQLERYALAYRNTEILGKTLEEIQGKAEEFIIGIGEELETLDLVQLYGLDIIPLKAAVSWGGEDIIEELLQSGRLKPADARYLRDEGLLNEQVLERLFKKCKQMVYSDQVSLVSAVFDGQTPEEQEIRERLAQYYNIESGMTSSKGKSGTGKRKISNREQVENSKRKVKMRDPGSKYNFLASIDEGVTVETGIIDGHIIFHYPNIDGGTVLIEKLHKIKTNQENGLIEIKADNESATYVLSEEEFIKMKSGLIQDGKIDRTQLTQKWWITRDPEHWIPHNGVDCWERALMERFEISEENTRYSLEDLKRIQELKAKSIESKKREER